MTTPISDVFDAINQGGVVVVGSFDTHAISPADEDRLRTFIRETDRLARSDAPGDAPPLCLRSACWAAQTMHFLCRTLLDRIDVATELPADLAANRPSGTSASEHWSVDLVLRVLADIDRRCAGANQLDPLRTTIRELAARWPLSAIGIQTDLSPKSMSVVLSHPTLRRILVDRIVARGDADRANLPCVADEIAAATPTKIPQL